MVITIYSHFADCPEWRIERSEVGLSTEPTWTGEFDIPATDLGGNVDPMPTLERIFRQFNAVDDADVAFMKRMNYTLPSLTSGDIVTIDGKNYFCKMASWQEISDSQMEEYKALPLRDKFLSSMRGLDE